MQRPVGRGVGNETEPRRLTGVDELDHPVGVVVRGIEIRRQVLVFDGLAVRSIQAVVVPEDLGEVTGRGAKLHEGAIESPGRGRIAVFQTQVPLAGNVGPVARVLEQFRDDRPVQAQPIGPFTTGLGRSNLQRFGDVCAGHHHDPRLLAGAVSAEVRQAHAGEGQFVEIGSGDLAAECADVGVAQVVGDDEENVGPRGCGLGGDIGCGFGRGFSGSLVGGFNGGVRWPSLVLGACGQCAGKRQGRKPGPGNHGCFPLNRCCSRPGT